jgi:hypothetical protein
VQHSIGNGIFQTQVHYQSHITPAAVIISAKANLSHALISNKVATHLNDLQLANLTWLRKPIKATPTSLQNAITIINTQLSLPTIWPAMGDTTQTYTPTPSHFQLR